MTYLERYLYATPRTLPQALGQYINNTKPGEHTRERVAVNLYLALPIAGRAETLGVIE
jgi:hypothetical protein